MTLEYLKNISYKNNVGKILKISKIFMKLSLLKNLIMIFKTGLRDFLVQTNHYTHEEIKTQRG